MLRRDKLPLALLITFWAGLYLPHLLAGHTLPARDLAATYLPWRHVWQSQVRAGVWPLWDPASNHGRPLWANPDHASTYPLTFLFAVIAPEHAVSWHVALHHLLFITGCFVLARRCGAPHGAAAIGAAAAATSGVAFSTSAFLPHPAALGWSPWVLVTAAQAPSSSWDASKRALAGGCILGVIFLTGEPVTAGLMSLSWVVVVLFKWPQRHWWGVAEAAVVAFGCAAPLLVPLIVTFPDTVRGAVGVGETALSADSLAPRRWLELVFPHLLGRALGDARTGFWAAASFPWQRYYPTIFLGSTALLTLPFARATGRDQRPWWLLFGTGVLGAAMVAFAPIEVALQLLPFARFVRYAIKLLLLSTVALAPLVAEGWENLSASRTRAGKLWPIALVTIGALFLLFALTPGRILKPALAALYPASRMSLASTPDSELRRAVFLDAVGLVGPPAVLLAAGPLPAVMVAATFGSNALGGSEVLAWDEASRWAQPPGVVASLPPGSTIAVLVTGARPLSKPGLEVLSRFWYPRAALVPNYGTRWDLRYVLDDGPNGLEPVRHELLVAATARFGLSEKARVAAALGARAIVADSPIAGWVSAHVDGVWVSSTDRYAPSAYLASRIVPAADLSQTAQIMASEGFRPGLDAAVEGKRDELRLGGGSVCELEGTPHSRAFDLTSDGPGLLVVQQSFMTCWKARVDGRLVPVGPLNGASIGVLVPPGHHRVSLFLDQRPYWIGLACCTGLLLIVVALWALARPRATSAAVVQTRRGREERTPGTDAGAG